MEKSADGVKNYDIPGVTYDSGVFLWKLGDCSVRMDCGESRPTQDQVEKMLDTWRYCCTVDMAVGAAKLASCLFPVTELRKIGSTRCRGCTETGKGNVRFVSSFHLSD